MSKELHLAYNLDPKCPHDWLGLLIQDKVLGNKNILYFENTNAVKQFILQLREELTNASLS